MGCTNSRNEGTEESSSAPPPPTKVVAPGPVVVDVKEQDVPVVEVKNLEVIPKEVANGTFYGKYSCTRELGSGSFSTIREAVCNETGRKFAVKIISRANISSEDEVSLEREVKILGELNHPNVVLLHEFHASRYFFHIVMELLGGGELFDRIVHESIYTEDEARKVMAGLLGAVAYIHGKGIIHRDIKPENLLLFSTNDCTSVKLADFGDACYDPALQSGDKEVDLLVMTPCGTPGYTSPEVLMGRSYGISCDVWSVGIILYILLGGYPPFHDHNHSKLFKKIKRGKVVFHQAYWANISGEVKDLIQRMLIVDPNDRVTAKDALRHPWFQKDSLALSSHSLSDNLHQLRLFNARTKLRAGIATVIATNRLRRLAA